MNSKNAGTLTGKLKKTILLLGIAMIGMWIFFYVFIRALITGYTLQNMERTAQNDIAQMNTSFLQMERFYLAMMQEEKVVTMFEQKDNLAFHNAAADAEERLQELLRGKNLLNAVILYQSQGYFYRLRGNVSNTGVERLLYLVQRQQEDYICIKLDNENYIGYIARLENGSGGVVMLVKETEIDRMLGQSSVNGMQFVLTAGEEIVASTGGLWTGESLARFVDGAEHIQSAQVGYTPFQLWVAYTEEDGEINFLFLVSMALMAILLFYILQIFLSFWNKNFFSPIQTVINEVETFEGGMGNYLPMTGQEHFDGLIRGINDLTARIEAKDRALLVSLKKQINAHFIFNILNIIKALSEKGESEKAGELCNGLSLLLRYANEGEHFIDGMEEFFMLENYVDIMEIRYPNRFQAEIDMEDFLEDVKLPRMLLQPLVENSILHGFIGGGKKGTVHVYAVQEGQRVRYVVEDDGCGMSEQALAELREKLKDAPITEPEIEGLSNVALVNIERRIKSYFGRKYGLEIESQEGKGTVVTMVLPGGRTIRKGETPTGENENILLERNGFL